MNDDYREGFRENMQEIDRLIGRVTMGWFFRGMILGVLVGILLGKLPT